MENNMSCATDAGEINNQLTYTCSSNLTGIKNMDTNSFYFRCKDQPSMPDNERNVNIESYQLDLRGSQPLTILSAGPNGTITGATDTINATLQVGTNAGSDDGKATCYFSPDGTENNFVAMLNTGSFISTQNLDLTTGNYTYFFRCIDAGGNSAETNTTFSVFVDKNAPKIARVYKQGTDALQIVTDKDALCTYSLTSCNFNIDEGIKEIVYPISGVGNIMQIKWTAGNTYHIKCEDNYGNQPNPNECSLVASAIRLSDK